MLAAEIEYSAHAGVAAAIMGPTRPPEIKGQHDSREECGEPGNRISARHAFVDRIRHGEHERDP
jgi:hypothetical protein